MLRLFVLFSVVILSACASTPDPVFAKYVATRDDNSFPVKEVANLMEATDVELAAKCKFTLKEAADATFSAGGPGGNFMFSDPVLERVKMAENFVIGSKVWGEIFTQNVSNKQKKEQKVKDFFKGSYFGALVDVRTVSKKKKAFLADIRNCLEPVVAARKKHQQSIVVLSELGEGT